MRRNGRKRDVINLIIRVTFLEHGQRGPLSESPVPRSRQSDLCRLDEPCGVEHPEYGVLENRNGNIELQSKQIHGIVREYVSTGKQ